MESWTLGSREREDGHRLDFDIPDPEGQPPPRRAYHRLGMAPTPPQPEPHAGPARVWVHAPNTPPVSTAISGERTLIGRGEHCDIQLEDSTVSRDHLELSSHGSSLIVTDLDSSNGTLLNGRELSRPTRLDSGDVLSVGRYRLEISLPGDARGTEPAPTLAPQLTEEERAAARALVAPFRELGALAPRPATRAEIAAALHLSERTVQRRVDTLAVKLGVPADSGRERPRQVAERVLALGLDR